MVKRVKNVVSKLRPTGFEALAMRERRYFGAGGLAGEESPSAVKFDAIDRRRWHPQSNNSSRGRSVIYVGNNDQA